MLIIKKFRHYLIRVKQSYFVSKLSSTEIKCVKNTLKPELQVIFFSQAMCDQRHGFLVFNKCKELFKDSVDISHDRRTKNLLEFRRRRPRCKPQRSTH